MLIPCLDHPSYFHFAKKNRRNSTITESTSLWVETTPAKRRNVFLLKLKKQKFCAKEEPRQALQWLYQCFLSWWTKSLILMVCDKYTTSTEWGTYHPLFLINHVSQKLWIFCSFLDSSEMLKPWYKYLPQSPGPTSRLTPEFFTLGPSGKPRLGNHWRIWRFSSFWPLWRLANPLCPHGGGTGEWSFQWGSRIRLKTKNKKKILAGGSPGSSSRDQPLVFWKHAYIYIYFFFVSFFEANVVGDLHFSKKSRLEDAGWIFFLHFFYFVWGKVPEWRIFTHRIAGF